MKLSGRENVRRKTRKGSGIAESTENGFTVRRWEEGEKDGGRAPEKSNRRHNLITEWYPGAAENNKEISRKRWRIFSFCSAVGGGILATSNRYRFPSGR